MDRVCSREHLSLSFPSFSAHGSLLCGVGKDRLGRTLVVMWDTSQLRRFGEVSVLTKAHTGVSIEKMRVASFDETRCVLRWCVCRSNQSACSTFK